MSIGKERKGVEVEQRLKEIFARVAGHVPQLLTWNHL